LTKDRTDALIAGFAGEALKFFPMHIDVEKWSERLSEAKLAESVAKCRDGQAVLVGALLISALHACR
jgi:hypothetical protein